MAGISHQMNFIKKEVLCDCLVSDAWKEITFNSSGTPSIQDIKIPQRTGGLNISNHSNRFIFWKTRGNVLELVEHSLDVNIACNQLRYKFEDSPVLGDSVSLYETKQNIVLLVATISSVHKIKFSRPKVISTRHEHVNSIFADASSAESINNPACFHIISITNSIPYTGASYLTPDREAIFSLALQSGGIAVIKINPNSEKAAKVFDVKSDSFFTGLNFFSSRSGRGALSQDSSLLGIVYKYINRTAFVVALNSDGQLKCWNGDMNLTGNCDTLQYCKTRNLVNQSHLLRKSSVDADPSVWVYLCLEGGNSCFLQFKISPEGGVHFLRSAADLPHLISSQMDQLIDFIVLQNLLWCVWHTMENESVVTAYNPDPAHGSRPWSYAQLEPLHINPTSPALCPQGKISDLIFKPGLFSRSDVAKALEIHNGGADNNVDSRLTLRQRVMQVVERDIDAKVNELPDEMDEVSRAASEHFISEQIWEDFYSACVQYRKMSLPPLGMFHIASANLLLVIKKNSFSYLRPMSPLEEYMYCVPSEISGADTEFDKFVSSLGSLHFSNNANQEIALALTDTKSDRGDRGEGDESTLFLSGAEQFQSLLNEFSHRDLTDIFDEPSELQRLHKLSNSELKGYIEQFLALLTRPPPSDVTPGSQYYTSCLGVNVLTMALNQIAELRLRLCCNLVITLKTTGRQRDELFTEYYDALWGQIRDAWIVTWLHNNVDPSTQDSVLLSYISSCELRHHNLISTTQLLFFNSNSHIIPYLSSAPHLAPFLQDISHILDYTEWKFDLIRAYLSTGNDARAYTIVEQFSEYADLDYFLQAIDIFSKVHSCELVIEIIHLALNNLGSQENTSVLHSILFDNYLRVKDFPKAFDTLRNNKDCNKQQINLHVLILNMLEAGKSKQLLNLLTQDGTHTTSPIIREVIDFCHKRMYTFPIDQAEVYFEFLFAFHVNSLYYSGAAQVKFNQAYCYSRDLTKRCECLAEAVALLHLVDEPYKQYVNRKKDVDKLKYKMYKGEKVYTELAFEQLSLKQVKNLYELEKSRAYVRDCPLDAPLEEVVSLLSHNGLYKKALQLATLWGEDLRPVFVSLTTRCLAEEVTDWDWIFLNDIGDYVNSAKMDIGGLMWALLEALLDIFELPGHKEVLKSVSEKIISQGYDLPQFVKRKYFSLCPGDVVHLLHKHGALKAATQLSIAMLRTLTSPASQDRSDEGQKGFEEYFSFKQLTPRSEQMYCGLQHVKFLQAELSRQEGADYEDYFDQLQEALRAYDEHAVRVTTEKFRVMASS
uniref:Nuclear pore complex protein Nup160 n=1 Tax=Cacopsylla melanoneura TaxID=428564 RepID=A0A8D8R6K1_9HEMI